MLSKTDFASIPKIVRGTLYLGFSRRDDCCRPYARSRECEGATDQAPSTLRCKSPCVAKLLSQVRPKLIRRFPSVYKPRLDEHML